VNALSSVSQGWNYSPAGARRQLERSSSLLALHRSESPADRVELGFRSKSPVTLREQRPATETRSNPNYYDAKADAVARSNFYGDPQRFDSMTPQDLFYELSSIVSEKHKPLDYDPAKYLYPQVDRHKDGQLYCIYSGDAPELPGGDSSNPLTGGEYNCEHVVPQSWFSKQRDPRGDLHHLFASVIDCNSLRGNSQYDQGVSDGQEMTACGIYSKEDNLFNPNAGHGETARAVLYFMLRYPGKIGDNKSEYGVNDIPMLLQWHKEHPPTEYEFHRNQSIEKLQGNRNPLIDFPQLAEKIDFTLGVGKQGR
jgi:endonuclease G, mitochondrial